jgi:hypothetical protein
MMTRTMAKQKVAIGMQHNSTLLALELVVHPLISYYFTSCCSWRLKSRKCEQYSYDTVPGNLLLMLLLFDGRRRPQMRRKSELDKIKDKTGLYRFAAKFRKLS